MPDLSTSDSSNILAAASATQYGIVLDGAVPKRYPLRSVLRGGSTYNVIDYGADPTFTSDSTLAINTVVNMCATSGGKPYFPKGHYKVSGALINTSSNGSKPNSQIVIPVCDDPTLAQNIVFEGEFWCNPIELAVEGVTTRPTMGVVIESTIDGTVNDVGINPAVIGSEWTSIAGLGNMSYHTIEMYNIEIRTKGKTGSTNINPTMSGINAYYLSMFRGDRIKITTSSTCQFALAPAIVTYGLITPRLNNRAIMDIGLLFVANYSYAIQASEHTYVKNLWVVKCGTAIVGEANWHGHQILFDKVHAEITAVLVEMRTASDHMKINSLGTEQYSDGGSTWTNYLYDFSISDATAGNVEVNRFHSSAPFLGGKKGHITINNTAFVDHVKLNINTGRDLHNDQFAIDQTTPVWKGWENGYQTQITLNGNKTIAVSYIPTGKRLRLTVIQDATGGRTLAFSGYTVTLATGTTIDTTASKATILEGYYDGTKIILYKVGGF